MEAGGYEESFLVLSKELSYQARSETIENPFAGNAAKTKNEVRDAGNLLGALARAKGLRAKKKRSSD